jgi:transcription elongation factor Elf1
MTTKALKEHIAHYCSKNPDVVPREFVCPLCGQIFERGSNLNKHHLAVHVDVKDCRQSTSIQATNKRKNEAKQEARDAKKAKIQEGEE